MDSHRLHPSMVADDLKGIERGLGSEGIGGLFLLRRSAKTESW